MTSRPGSALTPDDKEKMRACFITEVLAEAARLRRVTSEEGADLVGRSLRGDYSGIVFPYFWPGEDRPRAYRLRRDKPDLEQQPDGSYKEKSKYLSAPGQRSMLYFAPDALAGWLLEASLPIAIVEGEKKTLALSRLSWHGNNSDKPRFLPIGVAGVWNWRGTIGKTTGPNGELRDVKGPIPDLERIHWVGRKAIIIFDANVATNRSVRAARAGLARELESRGTTVSYLTIHQEEGINGIDDFLGRHGANAALELIENAQSVEANVPSGFRVSESGVYAIDPKGEGNDLWLCSELHITSLSRSRTNEKWGRVLQFQDADGNMHCWVMPSAMLSNDGSDYRAQLMSMGLLIAPSRKCREIVTRYIQMSSPARRVRIVDRVGWEGGVFVLPDQFIGETVIEQIMLQSTSNSLIQIAGTLDEWRDDVCRVCSGNSRLIFAVSCAFASPLLELVGEDGGGFHYRGPTSQGKTTALRVAGSVWGGGGFDGFLETWRATANGLEVIAEMHNHALLCLDEIGQCDGREVSEIAYQLSNGSGKGRMARNGTARHKPEWKLLVLSSGEISLADHAAAAGKRTRGGHEVRFVDIEADAGLGLGIFEDIHGFNCADSFARHLTLSTRKYYGSAIRAYLLELVDNRDDAIASVRSLQSAFRSRNLPEGSSGEVSRVGSRFALVAAAGELSTAQGITGWCEGEALTAAESIFQSWIQRRGTLGGTDEESAIRQVRSFIEAHGASRFQSVTGEPDRIVNRAGFKRIGDDGNTEYLFLPETFRKEVCAGLDWRLVVSVLTDRGFLIKGDGRHTKLRVQLPELGRPRVYAIRSALLETE